MARIFLCLLFLFLACACSHDKAHTGLDSLSEPYETIAIGMQYDAVATHLGDEVYSQTNNNGSVTHNHIWGYIKASGSDIVGVTVTVQNGRITYKAPIKVGRMHPAARKATNETPR